MIVFSLSCYSRTVSTTDTLIINFLGKQYDLPIDKTSIKNAIQKLEYEKDVNNLPPLYLLQPAVNKITILQKELQLADWLVYQLIRRIAEQINSKYIDYTQYTLTKYVLLSAVGFEPLIYTSKEKILLYVKSSDTIYNLPNKIVNGLQYVCLNYHDYQFQINFQTEQFHKKFDAFIKQGIDFNYRIDYLPSFQRESYSEKSISFQYKHKKESYKVLVKTEIQDYFTNYPVTEYRYQFNIPFSEITYNTLIPELKSRVKKLTIEKGVEYLMLFVRDGFEFETDTKLFGREKRLSAEETLISSSSDCEDRSALFFSLVKEIYNLPMAIISYPEHVNVAVLLPKPKGVSVVVGNQKFTICEPTPQKFKRGIGWMSKELRKQPYEIAYVYLK
ncbi:MAG: hypothetical protein RLZZ520_1119 [Bacteroidota bacterium]